MRQRLQKRQSKKENNGGAKVISPAGCDNMVYRFKNLSKFASVRHGISTRQFGSMRLTDPQLEKHLSSFAHVLGIQKKQVILMEQTHNDIVYTVNATNVMEIIPQTDGLITDQQGIYLAVRTADCLPILLYDPKRKIVAAIHAGWRGIYKKIITRTIRLLVEHGSNPKDLTVGVGPAIGVCCYEFGKDTIRQFEARFGDVAAYASQKNDSIYLDQIALAKMQLFEAGVRQEHLEIANICTKDHLDTLYSYRGEGVEKFGTFISVIGMV